MTGLFDSYQLLGLGLLGSTLPPPRQFLSIQWLSFTGWLEVSGMLGQTPTKGY